MTHTRILLVPDAINGEYSGARSARATVRTLLELGYTVGVYSKDVKRNSNGSSVNNANYFGCTSRMRFFSHFFDPFLLREFRKVLDEFNPNYILFAGSIQKPSIMARASRNRGIKTIFLFYMNDYFCAKVYAALETGPCFRCIEKDALQALKNDCIKKSPKLLYFLKGWLVRRQLRGELLRSYRVVGYSEDQLNIYHNCGIDKVKCAKIGFQFDPKEVVDLHAEDKGYFLLFGQPIVEKGWHVMAEVFSNLQSNVTVKILFKDLETARVMLKRYGLIRFVDSGMIEIVCDIRERRELLSIVAFSRAVIIPTYYPTTGEFVLLESLLLGKPVIVFDAGVHKEIIRHRVNGMVAGIGDLATFSRNIDEINLDSDLRESVSRGARNLADALFSDEARLGSFKALFP